MVIESGKTHDPRFVQSKRACVDLVIHDAGSLSNILHLSNNELFQKEHVALSSKNPACPLREDQKPLDMMKKAAMIKQI